MAFSLTWTIDMNLKQEEKHMPLTQSNERIITELEIRAKLHRQEKIKAWGSMVKEEKREW